MVSATEGRVSSASPEPDQGPKAKAVAAATVTAIAAAPNTSSRRRRRERSILRRCSSRSTWCCFLICLRAVIEGFLSSEGDAPSGGLYQCGRRSLQCGFIREHDVFDEEPGFG